MRLPYLIAVLLFTVTANAQINYQPLYDNSTFNNRDVTVKPVGSTPGAAGVSPTGAATYNIPIWCPPGTNGMQPNISLVYNSQAGNGIVGMGWNISGLSMITRVGSDIQHDGKIVPVDFSDNDWFALDGVRLVGKSGTYGDNNSTYALESEDFSYIASYGDHGGDPATFFVTKKDGTLLQYGNTNKSRFLSNDGTEVMMWCLNKVVDKNGNYIEFEYSFDDRSPRLEKIKYTGNIYTSTPTYNTIDFDYNYRLDANEVYEGGSLIASPFLLERIKIIDENNVVRKSYELTYGNDGINSYLREVTEVNKDNEKLNSIQFKYGSVSNNIEDATITGLPGPAPSVPYIPDHITGDFNGDGISEILIVNKNYTPQLGIYDEGFSIYKKNSSNGFIVGPTQNYQTPTYVKVKKGPGYRSTDNSLSVADFNGDGLEDVLVSKVNIQNGGSKYTPTSFDIYYGDKNTVLNTTNISSNQPTLIWGQLGELSTEHTSSAIGDFDGDGKSDLITLCEGNAPNHYTFIYEGGTNPVPVFGIDFSIISHSFQMRLVDFDGDGKNDIMFLNQNYSFVYSFIKQSNGMYNAILLLDQAGYPNLWHKIWTGDFNGDGKTDVLTYVNGYKWSWGISTGKTFLQTFLPIISETFEEECSFDCGNWLNGSSGTDRGDDVIIADYNGDSRSDIIFSNAYCPCSGNSHTVNTTIDLYLSRKNYLTKVSNYINSSAVVNPQTIIAVDIYGTGRQQLMFRFANQNNFNNLSIKGTENPLEGVADGFGNDIYFQHESMSTSPNYTKGTNSQYPLVDLKMPLKIVTQVQQPNGLGSYYTTLYKYSYAVSNITGLGFLGFKKIVTEIPSVFSKSETITDIKTITDNNITYYLPYIKETNTFNTFYNQQITHTTNNVDFVQGTTSGTFYQKLLSSNEQNLLTGANTSTTNTYDGYNFGTITNSLTDINGIESINTTITYIQAGNATIPCMPDLVTVTKTRNGLSSTEKTKFSYDGSGRVATKNEKHLSSFNVYNIYEYDDFGNLTKHRFSNSLTTYSNPNQIENNYTYDNKGRFQLTSTNPLAQVASTTWDPVWGKPLTQTGLDGITTKYIYDTWGRLTSSTEKFGIANAAETTTYTTGWKTDGTQYYSLVSHPDKPDVKIWYDKLGREVKTEVEHLNGNWTTNTKTYDAKGNLSSETAPKLSSEPTFTTNYYYADPYNRITSSTNNFGTTSYSYNFLGSGNVKTTVTNPASQSISKTVDATGKTIEETDNGGKLTYQYNSQGNVLTVKRGLSTVVTNTYNTWGVLTNNFELGKGTTKFAYDAFGRLKSKTNPNNYTHQYQYNELGQITQRSGPEGTTTYSYNTAGPEINQLATITGFNGVNESFLYDSLGRLQTKEKLIDGNIYSTTFTYDNYDKLTKKQYSDGYFLEYSYSNGYLKNVIQPFPSFPPLNTPYLFKGNTINGQGQYTNYSLLNTATTTNTYYHGYLTNTLTPALQDLEMSYDYTNGNLAYRYDHVKNMKEEFIYDNLNRLTQSQIVGQSPSYSITYDQANNGNTIGNINSKSDVGSYKNNQAGQTYFTANEANEISEKQQDITYTQFLKTASVTEEVFPYPADINNPNAPPDLYVQNFTYDAGYDRVKTEVLKNGVLELTRLYLDDYEVNIDPITNNATYIHYIAGGDGLCAIAEVQNYFNQATNNVTYHVIYKDHLGSIVTTTDASGNVDIEQNFDAWGRERHPDYWDYNTPRIGVTSSWLYRGYTGHEHMPHFRMINMNGRMYDPILGRMMSADPYSMGGTQGYNRYSYCLNNPLKYTDPSGMFVKATMFILGFSCEFIRNVVTGSPDALGSAYNTTSYRLDQFGSAWQFKIYSDDKSTLTAGLDPFNVGLSANYYRKEGNWNFSASAGYGFLNEGYASVGASYQLGDWSIGMAANYSFNSIDNNYNIGAGVSYDDGSFSASIYQTYYGSNKDEALNQWNTGFSVGLNGLKIREENDFFTSDKGRTQALEFSYENLSIGSFIQTNDPRNDGRDEGAGRPSPTYGYNHSKKGYTSWKNGQVVMAPVYFGYQGSRLGYSSWKVQDVVQNGMHTSSLFKFGNQNYYLNYGNMSQGFYRSSSFSNSYSLYGF